MANFEAKELDLSKINGGQRYQNGDLVDAEAINAPIEAAAWAQANLNSKVPKMTSTSSYDRVYSQTSKGNESFIEVSQSVKGEHVVRRTQTGAIQVPSMPQDSSSSTSKYYVDNIKFALEYRVNGLNTNVTALEERVAALESGGGSGKWTLVETYYHDGDDNWLPQLVKGGKYRLGTNEFTPEVDYYYEWDDELEEDVEITYYCVPKGDYTDEEGGEWYVDGEEGNRVLYSGGGTEISLYQYDGGGTSGGGDTTNYDYKVYITNDFYNNLEDMNLNVDGTHITYGDINESDSTTHPYYYGGFFTDPGDDPAYSIKVDPAFEVTDIFCGVTEEMGEDADGSHISAGETEYFYEDIYMSYTPAN